MIVRIDQMAATPIYQQLRDQVVAAIASGELAVGDALPPVRTLAADLGINLHTVNKAYALLRDDGYLIVRGRSGAFVAEPMRLRDAGFVAVSDRRLEGALASAARDYASAGGNRGAFAEVARRVADEVFGPAPEAAAPKVGPEPASPEAAAPEPDRQARAQAQVQERTDAR